MSVNELALTQLKKDVKYWRDKKEHYILQRETAELVLSDDPEGLKLQSEVFNTMLTMCDSMVDHYLDKYNAITERNKDETV